MFPGLKTIFLGHRSPNILIDALVSCCFCSLECMVDVSKYPLVMTNIAMGNGPFIDVPINVSIYNGLSMAMLNSQMIV